MRLIDADALGIGRCSKDLLPAAYCAGWNGVINLIEDAPTIDAVPVVRCKDCEHFADAKGKDSGKPCGYGSCNFAVGIRGIVCADDFCSFGKRKDDE